MKITVMGSGAWGTALALVLLENGRVAASGTPQAVFATEAFARAFPVEARKGEA